MQPKLETAVFQTEQNEHGANQVIEKRQPTDKSLRKDGCIRVAHQIGQKKKEAHSSTGEQQPNQTGFCCLMKLMEHNGGYGYTMLP